MKLYEYEVKYSITGRAYPKTTHKQKCNAQDIHTALKWISDKYITNDTTIKYNITIQEVKK